MREDVNMLDDEYFKCFTFYNSLDDAKKCLDTSTYLNDYDDVSYFEDVHRIEYAYIDYLEGNDVDVDWLEIHFLIIDTIEKHVFDKQKGVTRSYDNLDIPDFIMKEIEDLADLIYDQICEAERTIKEFEKNKLEGNIEHSLKNYKLLF